MIGKLKGLVDSTDEGKAIIDVGGVGYLVFSSARTLRDLPSEGQAVELLIETHVREDHIHLYGFLMEEEQQWFKTLITVNGVGTKMALAILSALSPAQLTTAIMAQDKASFTQVSGVGPKLADRLLTELKNKAGVLSSQDSSTALTSVGESNIDIS